MPKRHFASITFGAALTALVTLSLDLPASADLIPTYISTTGDATTGFIWTYNCDLTVDQRIEVGDYFTIYDFEHYIPGSATNPAGWSFIAQPVGTTPSVVLTPDNPAVFNLTWTWTGATTPGPLDLGFFTAKTDLSERTLGYFTGYATKDSGPEAGTKIANVGRITTPGLPEPSVLCLMGSGFLGCIALMRRRSTAP